MIRQLKGIVSDYGPQSVLVEVSGIGYIVFVTNKTKIDLPYDTECKIYTHLSVKEDALDLYGFSEKEDLSMFEMLLSVSGIGPKSALTVLDQADRETLSQAIIRNDSSYLTKLSGIGKKTAERIVYELKDKVIGLETTNGGNDDLLDALIALGFKEQSIRSILKDIDKNDPTEIQIKKALQILAK